MVASRWITGWWLFKNMGSWVRALRPDPATLTVAALLKEQVNLLE